jgi:hypothetical protein
MKRKFIDFMDLLDNYNEEKSKELCTNKFSLHLKENYFNLLDEKAIKTVEFNKKKEITQIVNLSEYFNFFGFPENFEEKGI